MKSFHGARMEPLTFVPLYMERVWGGRELERVYGRHLPGSGPIGEAWEIVDRDAVQSVVSEGELQGMSLHDLWQNRRAQIFGEGFRESERFPILMKFLDARDHLSIQVHPPEHVPGDPKTEMWVIAECEKGAQLYAGLRQGSTRQHFEQAIRNGTVAQCVHALTPRAGESIFIPSGRLHAIGAGFLICEIQQNSDTTFRVFDWNRTGLDGRPRELHVEESLASIDFDDVEPTMSVVEGEVLASCPFFRTVRKHLRGDELVSNPSANEFSIFVIMEGSLKSAAARYFSKGQTLLLPRNSSPLEAVEETTILQITLPR